MSRISDILERNGLRDGCKETERATRPHLFPRDHVTRGEEFPFEFVEKNFPPSTPQWATARMMYDYCRKLLWPETSDSIDARQQAAIGILRTVGEKEGQKLIAKAHSWSVKANEAVDEAIKAGRIEGALKRKMIALGGPAYSFAKGQLEKIDNFGTAEPSGKSSLKPLRLNAYGKHKKIGPSYETHPNDIYGLKPSKAWELYVDESGTGFFSGEDGVIAGVLSDLSNPLPVQPSLHAMTDKTAESIKAANELVETLVTHSNAGVLALPIRAQAASAGWAAGVASLIDIVLRLLPLDAREEKVSLKVLVEIRGAYEKAEHFVFLKDACLFSLARTFPERANKIDLHVEAMDKTCPYNAYPDIVANACHTALTRACGYKHDRLLAAQWEGTCFLNYEAGSIEKLFDDFRSGRQLDGKTWDHFLSNERTSHSIVSAMLARFGEEAQAVVEIWNEYLSWTIGHLESKAIDIWRLGRQIGWLEKYRPQSAQMPKRLQLLWKTVTLAQRNHMGGVLSDAEYAEYRKLASALYEEDAPLTCWATLHLAVAETNAFRFKQAKRIVEEYLKLIRSATWGADVPKWLKKPADLLLSKIKMRSSSAAAIPGLCYYGQLISSYGQHYSFLDDNETAINYFTEAIKTFKKLSDPSAADSEIKQTMAYLVIAKMDSAKIADDEARKALAEYLCGDPCDAARSLSRTPRSDRKYHHHVLLRYMFSGRPANDIKAAYLENKSNWASADGHPWELIECYRAMLCEDPVEQIDRFKAAMRLSDVGDVTLQVISLTMLGCLLALGGTTRADYCTRLEKVLKLVPDLGEKRAAALRAQPDKLLQPNDFIKAVLPFNFR